MALKRVSLFLCILAIWAVDNACSASTHSAPAPSVDCSTMVLNMADCLSFVTNGSTVTKPEGTCCSGLKTVLKADPECLCEAFKSSAQFGVVLNITKAVTLPSACRISAPSISNCRLSTAPGAAPALSPSSPTPAASGPTFGANELVPAVAPAVSGSAVLSVSVASLVACPNRCILL
ncbi:hypothetical protein L1049_014771 [Liquidambar formosana]|uniref:Bifunctional inhibitor/plant lipid transfer protein/seed storage helical domain-containing protein n=1 Tax=Liquidambar formosana TaxID=63359 RepID=A0AAP0X217_LIQFO